MAKLIRPATVTTSNLTSNVTNTYSAWNSGTAYVVGNQVTYGFRYYQSIQNGTNKQPDTETTYWSDIGPSNVGAMFDNQTSTPSTRASDISVTIAADGTVDSVALLYIDASAVNITVTDGVTEYYNEDISLTDNSGIDDWYAYFFEPITRKTELFRTNLPNIYNPEITITTTATGTVSIGTCVVGQYRELGDTQYGAQVGFTDYSRINYDATGAPEDVTIRSFVRSNRFTLWVEAAKVDYIINLLASYRGTPVVVIGADEYTSTYGFGILKAGYMAIAYPSHSTIDVELQGF